MINLKINNIGKIRNADINIDGITVVGAKNDSGKSTISKVLGTTFISMNKYKDKFQMYRINNIQQITNRIIDLLENTLIDNNININELPIELRELIDFEDGGIFNFRTFRRLNKKSFKENLEIYLKALNGLYNELNKYITYENKTKIKEYFDDIDKFFITNINDHKSSLILEFFEQTFGKQIVSFHNTKDAQIKISENNSVVFNLEFNDHGKINYEKNIVNNSLIKNIAYIDNPQILDNVSSNAFLLFNDFMDNNIFNDSLNNMLMHKNDRELTFKEIGNNNNILKEINNIVKGNMKKRKNSLSKAYYFEKGSYQIETRNVASGIKSFSILQILIENGWINDELLLIFDEPETNLHPVWQVKYAEILYYLHKKLGVKMYINTHSTHIIEAFQILSKNDDKTNFYMLEDINQYSNSVSLENKIQLLYEELNGAFDLLDTLEINKYFSDEDK
ncbi:AAA family ATPase [Macrococcus epidermidis]|uniref:AAA family ATPase n=1 Tax=Macrococcus epidermidis TaxID=1902580 RepID=UPI0020B67BFB|nr:AAA family ATPase [Macrococcus epidermidis]UTH15208.1 AAA family ATPase [Macrococcus epidermidis]